MSAARRVDLIKSIASSLSSRSPAEVRLILGEFGIREMSWEYDIAASDYCLVRLRDAELEQLEALNQYLTPSPPYGGVSASTASTSADCQKLRVFLSHPSQIGAFVTGVQVALRDYGLESFVAHLDIEPAAQWAIEIQRELRACRACVAFLTPDFRTSKWTDHEIAYALASGAFILPVRMGLDPYGLIASIQALRSDLADPITTAKLIAETLFGNPVTEELAGSTLASAVANSGSFAEARTLSRHLSLVTSMSDSAAAELRGSIATNVEIARNWGSVKTKITDTLVRLGK